MYAIASKTYILYIRVERIHSHALCLAAHGVWMDSLICLALKMESVKSVKSVKSVNESVVLGTTSICIEHLQTLLAAIFWFKWSPAVMAVYRGGPLIGRTFTSASWRGPVK